MLPFIIEKLSFPLVARREGLRGVMAELASLEQSQYWPHERILDLQMKRLKALVVHAYENTRFYKERFDRCGFDPYAFRHADELRKIPLLTKSQIRARTSDLIARNYSQAEIHSTVTGGTTGVKMMFYRDNQCLPKKEAALLRFGKWAGWGFGDYTGLVWPAREDVVGFRTRKARIKNELFHRYVVFPAALMDEDACERYVRLLSRKRPTMILAFSTPLHELARYMEKWGGSNVRLKGVITTGEPLYAHQRDLIARVFRCPVFDSYRTRETGPIAQECEVHDGLHINAEYLHIDTEADDRLVSINGHEAGRFVVTDLVNYGMPFIRYDLGDLGVMRGSSCPCGRGLPLIGDIAGRTADTLVTPGGRLVSSLTLTLYFILLAPSPMGQVQVVQDALDHLTIRMTRDPLPTRELLDHHRKMVSEIFGDEMKMTHEYVDSIPTEPSGKYLFARRLIPGREA